jgi:isopenicillin N synthase-like dioxygenase
MEPAEAPSAVPTVDLTATTVGDDLAAGLSSVGFVSLINHGLDLSVMANLRAAADRFFDLDLETKRSFVNQDPLANRGFRARGSEALAYSLGVATPPDMFESFNAGPETAVAWSELIQPTPWPDGPVPEYRPAVTAALDQFSSLGRSLDRLIGDIIGLEDLGDRSTSGPDMLACIDYRTEADGTETVIDGQLRMGAHTDYTTYTLLLADPVPGLQIVGPDGTWQDVIPEPGALLMNVGDLLAIWTNDRWPSTLHRVVPAALGGAPRRRSVAWFHYPDPDVGVSPLPRFIDGDRPRYEPVTVEEHVRGKLGAPKTMTEPESASTVQGRMVD